jgi:hypothetical protein
MLATALLLLLLLLILLLRLLRLLILLLVVTKRLLAWTLDHPKEHCTCGATVSDSHWREEARRWSQVGRRCKRRRYRRRSVTIVRLH